MVIEEIMTMAGGVDHLRRHDLAVADHRGSLGALAGPMATITSLALSPDGTHLAATSAEATYTWDRSP